MIGQEAATFYGIPLCFVSSLDRYVRERIPTGGFLRAVLENDLFEACGRADPVSALLLQRIVMYIHNELPGTCHGGESKVLIWLEAEDWEKERFSTWEGETRIDPSSTEG